MNWKRGRGCRREHLTPYLKYFQEGMRLISKKKKRSMPGMVRSKGKLPCMKLEKHTISHITDSVVFMAKRKLWKHFKEVGMILLEFQNHV